MVRCPATGRVFTPVQVFIVSVFGTFLAGWVGFLWNERVLNRPRVFWWGLGLGACLAPALIALALGLPDHPLDRLWPLALALLISLASRWIQGPAIAKRQGANIQPHRWWALVSVILLTWLLVFFGIWGCQAVRA